MEWAARWLTLEDVPKKPPKPAVTPPAPPVAPLPVRPPRTVLGAGLLVALEGAAAVVVALVLVFRQLAGTAGDEVSGWGTAVTFAVLGAPVLVAGVAMLRGQRWGRAIAIVVQLLLLPVAWTLLTSSNQPLYGGLLAAVVVATLGLLMAGASSRWLMDDE